MYEEENMLKDGHLLRINANYTEKRTERRYETEYIREQR